jgi:NTE family protein
MSTPSQRANALGWRVGENVAQSKNNKRSKTPEPKKSINLALQGGGAHGAFGWGVMDKFLEDGRLEIEGISGASAGSMNAVVYAYGKLRGNDGAREALHNFWKAVSDSGQQYVFKPNIWQKMCGMDLAMEMMSQMGKWMATSYSPYQLNPFNYNPLRDILEAQIDFEELERSSSTKLFLSATNVRTGNPKVFYTEQVNADIVMASACLPQLFHSVEIEGEHYWDGGYMGNPVLYPLFYHTKSVDVVILHIVPIERAELPYSRVEIDNRVNEITFNCALMKEMRAIVYVQKLINDGWFKDEVVPKLKYIFVHSVRADRALSDLSLESKMESDWGFLTMLRDRGRACAAEWLAQNYQHVGVRSSVDMQKDFL